VRFLPGAALEVILVKLEVIYIKPLLSWQVLKSPVQARNREYPIDFDFHMDKYVNTDGYTVEQVPEPLNVSIEGFKYSSVFQEILFNS
jgi:hypothetical protein